MENSSLRDEWTDTDSSKDASAEYLGALVRESKDILAGRIDKLCQKSPEWPPSWQNLRDRQSLAVALVMTAEAINIRIEKIGERAEKINAGAHPVNAQQQEILTQFYDQCSKDFRTLRQSLIDADLIYGFQGKCLNEIRRFDRLSVKHIENRDAGINPPPELI